MIEYLYSIPKAISDKTIEFLGKYLGFTPSARWTNLLLFFIYVGIFYLGTKITNKIAKWTLIIMGIILIGGMLLFPSW